jgi:RimJ/RimL family protein N-acetyltransferase
MSGVTFLETERLRLRRFTTADVDLLVGLDADPAVMRHINGGRPTPRAEIVADVLPAFLSYYDRFADLGFWAGEELSSGSSWAGSTCGPVRTIDPGPSNSGTGCAAEAGAAGTRRRAREP